MSGSGKQIVCRKCKTTISTEAGSCPQCGTSIRNDIAYFAGIALGVIMMGATLFAPSDLLVFGVVGLLIAAGSGYLVYEKRKRIQQAGTEQEKIGNEY